MKCFKDSSKVYTGGMTTDFNGKTSWWTKGEVPGSQLEATVRKYN